MKARLLSAYIDADGEVVALTETGCYFYGRELNEKQAQKLLKTWCC